VASMFERPHHQRIARLLHALAEDVLAETACYFAGGTAIVLALGEYRESADVDFLCASADGYRQLRNAVVGDTLGRLLKHPVRHLRPVRADRYGIRTVLEMDSTPIRVEFVREDRIAIDGAVDAALGIPTLSRVDMMAEKLLANADRGDDRSTLSRDIIDLAMMIHHWGAIPDAAWAKVTAAYGESARTAFKSAADRVRDGSYLKTCLHAMRMETGLMEPILRALDAAASGAVVGPRCPGPKS